MAGAGRIMAGMGVIRTANPLIVKPRFLVTGTLRLIEVPEKTKSSGELYIPVTIGQVDNLLVWSSLPDNTNPTLAVSMP
jgi:hypothetical protein